MAYLTDGYYSDVPAAMAVPSERVTFLRKTYAHLAIAILAFVGLEYLLIGATPIGEQMFSAMVQGGRFGMLFLMLAFVGAGYAARAMARSRTSVATQYLGLALYVVVEALIFVPIMYVAERSAPHVIGQAGVLTIGLFVGLSAAVLLTKADFSWMATGLIVVSWIALAIIIAGAFFGGFTLGLWFSGAMIALAAAYIVYDTSMILHHYPTSMYVGAALELFAAVALLFFYILRFALEMNSRRN
ncbi:MAG: Bax inhibitor-1 family protein [Gemmataceae bacterium]